MGSVGEFWKTVITLLDFGQFTGEETLKGFDHERPVGVSFKKDNGLLAMCLKTFSR